MRLPAPRWARWALFALVGFALLRSLLWASVQPGWFAPDEDYHWLYINYLVEEHAVPSLDRPFYTAELYKAVLEIDQGQYLVGPRTVYRGDPHAVLRLLGGPESSRQPALPKPRPVLHPPLYYLGGALVDLALNSKVSVTRLTGIRYYSAAIGAVTVFFAWLLAAQVLAREWERLAAAAITATQPILAFSASTITNDVAVAAILTATLAYCAWMLRAPPERRYGIGLGVLLSIALFTKATMFSLVIVIGVALFLAWRTYPGCTRELMHVVKWVVALPVLLVGWWYVRLVKDTGSILGARANLTGGTNSHGPGLLHAPAIAWNWLTQIYRSYWFDYLSYEVVHQDIWFWLPMFGIVVLGAGFVLYVARHRSDLTAPGRPQLRQSLVLALAALVLLVPPFLLDVLRGTEGLQFTAMQGRFLTPAYPGLAVIAVIALRELTRGMRRAFPWILASVVAGAFVFYWHTWIVWVLERFYGPIDGHWLRALWHASFDKPTFVTQSSLAAALLGAMALFVAAYVITIWGALRDPSRQDTQHQVPVRTQRRGDQRSASNTAEIA